MKGAAAERTPGPAVLDLQLTELLDELGVPASGLASGVAAAVAASMAAQLAAGAARRSAGEWEHAGAVAAQGHALRLRIEPLASADARAYAEARALLEVEAQDEADSSPQRDHLLGQALLRAAAVPLLIAERAADVALLAVEVADRGSPHARADAAAAAALAHGAARAAAHLVRVNLGAGAEDRRVVAADAAATSAGASAEAALAPE